MRNRLLLPALLLLAALSGCGQTPVQTAADDARPAADELTSPADTTGRGGNVMGGGH
jgi:hypothetical protein